MTAPIDKPLADGVYLNLDAEVYHAVPALSNSGIKRLNASPFDFWWQSWMNPNRPEEIDTTAKTVGTAYHTRILDGAAAFDKRYARALDTSDLDGWRTLDDLREACKERGLPVGGNKEKLAARLVEFDPALEDEIIDRQLEIYEGVHDGKTFLKSEIWDRIQLAASVIENHPVVSKCFTGGLPEVSIFWHENGVPLKARLDYLKARAIIDLKTFGNPYERPILRAVAQSMANERYHIQAAMYQRAVSKAMFYEVDLEPLLKGHHEFIFVFQQTAPRAPVVKPMIFPRGLVYDCGMIAVEAAIEKFKECRERFGDDPWIDDIELGRFEDSDLPSYMVE